MGVVVNNAYSSEKELRLTITANSVDSSAGPLFLIRRNRREILLADSRNTSILTLRPKRMSLRRRWEGFAGTGQEGSRRIFSVRREFARRSEMTAEVYGNPMAGKFRIKRSWEKGGFDVYDDVNRAMVAEMRREGGKVVVRAMPGSDCAFAVAIAVVVEQIGDDVFL